MKEEKGAFIMQQEQVDLSNIPLKLTTSQLPNGLNHDIYESKDKYKMLGVLSDELNKFSLEDKSYVSHSLFFNDMSEKWVLIIYYY